MRHLRAAVMAAAFVLPTGCGGKSAPPPRFDGQRAFGLLKKQCEFGPRYPGAPGHDATADLILSELKGTADEAVVHPFKKTVGGKRLTFKNIYAVFNPKASRFVLLCAHWDTRPMADMEADPAKRGKPIPGANDGASGVAVLLELARAFRTEKPKIGVVMAFFDGEDYGARPDQMYIGSTEFAKTAKSAVRPNGREIEYDYGILLDMVGDSDLQIAKEGFSVQKAPDIVDKVWAAARRAGHGDVFLEERRYWVRDDHVQLFPAGIKCIDVIDFDYAHWHTLDDTVDRCSANSLQVVGEVISRVIYEEGAPAK